MNTYLNIGIMRINPMLAIILVPVFFVSAQRQTSIDRYGCGFCSILTRREVQITNYLPYTIKIQCRTSDHSRKPEILHHLQQYRFTLRLNLFWETRYSCSFTGGGRKERTFEVFYSKYDCNNEKVNYICKWNIGKWSARRYSWEKKSWLASRYQYEL